jgi:hypothetical protein
MSLAAYTLNELVVAAKKIPQAAMPVIHHFGPGIYMRELHIPADTFAIGRKHRFEHTNILLEGMIVLLDEHDDGVGSIVSAPAIWTAPAGQKKVYVVTDAVWLNVFSTNETDPYALECMLVEQDETEPTVQHNMPVPWKTEQNTMRYSSIVTVRPSPIHGMGVFLTFPVNDGDIIADAERYESYLNHSQQPNAALRIIDGRTWIVAIKDIEGCIGGGPGTELTINYCSSEDK